LLESKEGADNFNGSGEAKRNSSLEMVNGGRSLLARDRRLRFGRMAIKENVDKELIRTITTGKLDKRKMCAKFAPRRLRDKKKPRFRGRS
jgi:hypothetical protein